MKIIVVPALCILIVCVIVAGCETTKDTAGKNTSPSPTFAPFHLRQGQVTLYVGGMTGEYPVFVDTENVGVVSLNRPLTLLLDEGNRTVELCCGVSCVHQNVTIRFGKPRAMDFSEQLEKECQFLEPTVRIVDYFMSGDQVTVNVEFINPTTKGLTISAEIRCVYSYIDNRSNTRFAHSAGGWVSSSLKPGDRKMQTMRLNVASGSGYIFDVPAITQVSSE
jgi:hypothetical protein